MKARGDHHNPQATTMLSMEKYFDWPAWRDARRQQAEKRLGPEEWIETAQFHLGLGEDIFRPAHIRFGLLRNRNGVVDRDLQALHELILELEQRFYTAQASLEKARAKLK